jgi:hypothetical protein
MGATQWRAAITRPPYLKCLVPPITASDCHEVGPIRGAFELGFNMSRTLANPVRPDLAHCKLPMVGLMCEALIRAVDGMRGPFAHLPLKDFPLLQQERLAPYYDDWLAPPSDAYWHQ